MSERSKDRGGTPAFTRAACNRQLEAELLHPGWIHPGDPLVLLAGSPLGAKGATNTLAIHYTGNKSTGYLRV